MEIPVIALGNLAATVMKKVKVFVTNGDGFVVPNGISHAKVKVLPAGAP